MTKTYDPQEIAIWIASDPAYQANEEADVCSWVDAWAPDLDEDAFPILLDRVLAVLPTVKPDREQAAEWRQASRECRAEEAYERRMFAGNF